MKIKIDDIEVTVSKKMIKNLKKWLSLSECERERECPFEFAYDNLSRLCNNFCGKFFLGFKYTNACPSNTYPISEKFLKMVSQVVEKYEEAGE